MTYLVLIALLVLPAVAGLAYLLAAGYRSLVAPLTGESESDRIARLLEDETVPNLRYVPGPFVNEDGTLKNPYLVAGSSGSGGLGLNSGSVFLGAAGTGGIGIGTGTSMAAELVKAIKTDAKDVTLQEQVNQIEGTQQIQQGLINDLKRTEMMMLNILTKHVEQYSSDRSLLIKDVVAAAMDKLQASQSDSMWGGQVIPPGHNTRFTTTTTKTKTKVAPKTANKKR